MKTYTEYEALPTPNEYLGSEDGNGYMSATLADLIAQSINPVIRLREDNNTYSYFEVLS